MARKTKRSRARLIFAGAVSLAMVTFVVLAGSNSTTLPNGANLAVSIDDPITCTEFIVPSGDPSIDVDVSGTASIGEGEADATFVYVMDVSGSTEYPSGSACGTYLQCQKGFFNALNAEVIASGQADLVGFAVYGGVGSIPGSAAAADMSSASGHQKLVAPDADSFVSTVVNSTFSDDGGACGVGQYQYKTVGFQTNFAAGLNRACEILSDVSNDNNTFVVVFASDGAPSQGGSQYQSQLSCLKNLNATIQSIAIGANSSCTTGGSNGTLLEMAVQTGGTCRKVLDPDDLPDIIPELIGSTLESLTMSIDGGAYVPIPDGDISLPLPQDGAVEVTYDTAAVGLDPNDHEICVTASGSDVTGGSATIDPPVCETIHLLQLAYGASMSPPDINATNDLNFETGHTVTVQIAGGTGPNRDVDFVVTGQNAGPAESVDVAAPGTGDFIYSVPQDCASLGTDTITASTEIAGVIDSIEFTKEWYDDVPPDVSCDEGVNPHGDNKPRSQNRDGFYQLNAVDPNIANCTVTLQVVDGDDYVFPGPFLPGDTIKYTQADGAPQQQKEIGSNNGQAGAVRWHLKGHGDLTLIGTDPSGNVSSAMCLVPPPPM